MTGIILAGGTLTLTVLLATGWGIGGPISLGPIAGADVPGTDTATPEQGTSIDQQRTETVVRPSITESDASNVTAAKATGTPAPNGTYPPGVDRNGIVDYQRLVLANRGIAAKPVVPSDDDLPGVP